MRKNCRFSAHILPVYPTYSIGLMGETTCCSNFKFHDAILFHRIGNTRTPIMAVYVGSDLPRN